jgi:hypothetical protein
MALNNSNQVGEAFIKVTAKMDPQSVQAAGNAIGTDLKAKAEQAGTAMEQAANKGESAFRRLFNSVRGGFSGFGGVAGQIGGGLARTAGLDAGGIGGAGTLGRLGAGVGAAATGVGLGVAAAFGIDAVLSARGRIASEDVESAQGTARRARARQEALTQRPEGHENYFRLRDLLSQQQDEIDQEAAKAAERINSFSGKVAGVAEYYLGQSVSEFFGIETPTKTAERVNKARKRAADTTGLIQTAQQQDFYGRLDQTVQGIFGQISGQTIGPGQSPDAAFADVNKTMLSVLAELKAINRNTQ